MNKGITMIRFLILLLPVFFIQCPAFYNLNKIDSKYYTSSDLVILEKTTQALDYGYAFDPELKLDYIYEFSRTKKELPKNEKEFPKAIADIDAATYINFYEKIYGIRVLTLDKLAYYKDNGEWKYVTYIEKYILPPLDSYLATLEKFAIVKDKTYKDRLVERKKAVEKQVRLQVQREMADKEFDERLWY